MFIDYDEIKVSEIQNMDRVEDLLTMDDCWRSFVDDGTEQVEDLVEWLSGFQLIVGTIENRIVGVCPIRWITGSVIEIHAFTPKVCRGPIAYATIRKILDFFFSECGDNLKFYAQIPSYNRSAAQGFVYVGAKRCGVITEAGLKSGIPYDLYLYSLSKEDFYGRWWQCSKNKEVYASSV